jgi:hypothetical protein
MPNIDQMVTSKFLKKDHVGRAGKTFTIKAVTERNVAKENEPKELKWCLEFVEVDTPMVLNKSNLQLAAIALGSKQSEDWINKKVTVYEDPTIQHKGEMKGGLRIKVN